jgi:hypothetical protein
MEKKKLEESDHGSMTYFENPFKKHKQKRHLFDMDDYDIETIFFFMILVILWIEINHQFMVLILIMIIC